MPSVLFVCSANICRSPMAEGLFRHLVKDALQDWQVGSAGVYAEPGLPAALNTLLVLQRRGIELPDHRSKPVTSDLLGRYGLVLTMEKGQKEALHAAFPSLASHVWLISEMVGKRFDIVDPVGRSLIEYEATARELESILSRGLEKICRLADYTSTRHDQP